MGHGKSREKFKSEKVSPHENTSLGEKFVNDFNALWKLSGFSARQAREKFLRRYKVRAILCANVEERMNNPKIPPTFAETASIAEGDFWACQIDENLFAVVPNLKSYTENHHAERAFGAVFNSNFVAGSYSKIQVIHAATFLFDKNWSLNSQGKLLLNP